MKARIIKRNSITAAQLRDFMLLDFEDGEPGMVSAVRHLAHKVLFTARNTEFSVDSDEILYVVKLMQLVEDKP